MEYYIAKGLPWEVIGETARISIELLSSEHLSREQSLSKEILLALTSTKLQDTACMTKWIKLFTIPEQKEPKLGGGRESSHQSHHHFSDFLRKQI